MADPSESEPPDEGPPTDAVFDMTESMRQVMGLGGDVDKLADFYDGWASGYDEDVTSHGYGLPAMMVTTLRQAVTSTDEPGWNESEVALVDAGCGTGLVGRALYDAGYRNLHGIDLSTEMIDEARRREIYRTLESGIDLAAPPPSHLARSADIVVVGGVFTVGHIAPSALDTVADLAVDGGLLVVSTRRAYQEQTDFDRHQRELILRGRFAPLVHLTDAPYTLDSTGDYWAWRVLHRS